ncbi:hypothetical protein Tco_0197947, partial [Tanacetum coccineum]
VLSGLGSAPSTSFKILLLSIGENQSIRKRYLEKKEATQSETKSSSTTRSNINEEDEKKCMYVVDYLARQAKGIVIEKQGTVTGKGKAHVAGKRRKRASGGIKRSNMNEEDEKNCMDVMDYLVRQAKGIVIEKQRKEKHMLLLAREESQFLKED